MQTGRFWHPQQGRQTFNSSPEQPDNSFYIHFPETAFSACQYHSTKLVHSSFCEFCLRFWPDGGYIFQLVQKFKGRLSYIILYCILGAVALLIEYGLLSLWEMFHEVLHFQHLVKGFDNICSVIQLFRSLMFLCHSLQVPHASIFCAIFFYLLTIQSSFNRIA